MNCPFLYEMSRMLNLRDTHIRNITTRDRCQIFRRRAMVYIAVDDEIPANTCNYMRTVNSQIVMTIAPNALGFSLHLKNGSLLAPSS
jgi:hypothetical protein